MPKSIFISYAEADKAVALDLHATLADLIGADSWIRDLDLNSGDILIEAINDAAADAVFFLILMSEAAATSTYLRLEANFASFRAVQDLGVRLLVLRLDQAPFPKHLEIALGSQHTIELASFVDPRAAFFDLAEYIEKHVHRPVSSQVYVDRGGSTDECSLLIRRNKVVFILGPAGIGKTSFVTQSIRSLLGKRPLTVRLTRGHSMDLLCRQLIRACHHLQPARQASDEELLSTAISAVKSRADRAFVFLDNAEEALDVYNQPLHFFNDFVRSFDEGDLITHVICATSRAPNISATLAAVADVQVLGVIGSKYIREQVELLVNDEAKIQELEADDLFDTLIRQTAGFPLAAKLLGSLLKVKTPQQLTQTAEWKSFELKLALHVLQFSNGTVLTALERLLLQVLAVVGEPMSMDDLMSSSDVANAGLASVQAAQNALSDMFLIEHSGELMSLHPFLQIFFIDLLSRESDLRERILHDVGMHAYHRALALNSQAPDVASEDGGFTTDLSNSILRYAIPANRLLRSVGRDDLVASLPFELKGTIREMVFYFYQEKRDYSKALEYAERWLTLVPDDAEIILFRARCYRNFRDPRNLAKAASILEELDATVQAPYFKSRVYRDRALVQQHLGNRQKAKEFFNDGITASANYTENYVGLAELLLKEADELGPFDKKREALVKRALSFLDQARRKPNPIVETLHLGLYIEALIEAGEEERALPLLRNALKASPNDPRLNHRMAEILRKQGDFEEAIAYSETSARFGHPKVALTEANIAYGQALKLRAEGDDEGALRMLRRVLAKLSTFRPEFGTDKEIADTIAAKAHRSLGDFTTAEKLLLPYQRTANPYTIYEMSRIELSLVASEPLIEIREAKLLAAQTLIRQRITEYRKTHVLPGALEKLLGEVNGEPNGGEEW